MLVGTCNNIDAAVYLKTVREKWSYKLISVIILRGVTTDAADLARLLPNFLVSEFKAYDPDDPILWLTKFPRMTGSLDGSVYNNHRGHPYQTVKKRLFHE